MYSEGFTEERDRLSAWPPGLADFQCAEVATVDADTFKMVLSIVSAFFNLAFFLLAKHNFILKNDAITGELGPKNEGEMKERVQANDLRF